MPTVLISGGTGLIGQALTSKLLQKGYAVILLTRDAAKYRLKLFPGKISWAEWNIDKGLIDVSAFGEADCIIHLAGAAIAKKRWTPARKKEIVESRIKSSRLLVESLQRYPNKVKTVISASAIGYYGNNDSSAKLMFDEAEFPAAGFIAQSCKQWEESILPVIAENKRLVIFRIGIVLSEKGGALKEFLKPIRFGIAAILGSGKQIVSWVHMEDIVHMFITAIENDRMQGVYNAVAPYPVSNRDLILALARSRRKIFIPVRVPSFIIKSLFGEMSAEVLKSAAISSKKIQDTGFQFLYPAIHDAFNKSNR